MSCDFTNQSVTIVRSLSLVINSFLSLLVFAHRRDTKMTIMRYISKYGDGIDKAFGIQRLSNFHMHDAPLKYNSPRWPPNPGFTVVLCFPDEGLNR